MAEKVTTMVINADLQCPSCYKKLKKLLGKFPEIRDRIYDAKQNTVTITVVSCCPERICDKLCSKGGQTIKSIEIKPPPKPKEPEKKPKDDKQTAEQKPPKEVISAPKALEWVPFPVSSFPTYYQSGGPYCNVYGYSSDPCTYGRPVPWYDNYGYGPYQYLGNTGPYVSPHEYSDEENSAACTIM